MATIWQKKLAFSRWRLVEDANCRRESMMLENQIQIIAQKVLMLIEFSSSEKAQTEECLVVKSLLLWMLMSYCRTFLPLGLLEDYPPCKALKHAHILDLLYNLIILKETPCLKPREEEGEERLLEMVSKQVQSFQRDFVETPIPTPLPINILSQRKILTGAIEIASDAIPELACLLDLTWKEIWVAIFSDSTPEENIIVPRAFMLWKNGFKFIRTDHITAIEFNHKSVSLHLPLIRLNKNSEVVFKNLVVYEAMIKPCHEQLVFARFVEIMSGIVRTVEDVMVLMENKVLELDSIRDIEVVEIFKGMRKSTRLTNTKELDRVVEEVNKYYNGVDIPGISYE